MERVHGRRREQIILRTLAEFGVATIAELIERTGASAATLRRDLARLAEANKLRRVHGGAESIAPAERRTLSSRSFHGALNVNVDRKRAIARRAVELCGEDESIIINGGSTTYRMVEFVGGRNLHILTNAFAMAEELVARTSNRVVLPGGEVYREQSVVLSPFEDDTIRNHYASKMFMGAQCLGPLGLMESDPLLISSEQKLLSQADELIVLVDSSKFRGRGSLILCPLSRIGRVITDDAVDAAAVKMLETAGVEVITVNVGTRSSTAA